MKSLIENSNESYNETLRISSSRADKISKSDIIKLCPDISNLRKGQIGKKVVNTYGKQMREIQKEIQNE